MQTSDSFSRRMRLDEVAPDIGACGNESGNLRYIFNIGINHLENNWIILKSPLENTKIPLKKCKNTPKNTTNLPQTIVNFCGDF